MKRSMKTLVGEVCACLAMSMLLVPFAGCGDGKTGGDEKLPEKELQELRKEIAQMKNELREMRRSIDRRPMGDSSMHRYPVKHAERFGNGMTNGVSRIRYARPRPTPEEMEERRKMMQNPEMRRCLPDRADRGCLRLRYSEMQHWSFQACVPHLCR